MFQESQNHIPGTWAGCSTISPNMNHGVIHLISYLEQQSYVAPLWGKVDSDDTEIAKIKTRLQTMGI